MRSARALVAHRVACAALASLALLACGDGEPSRPPPPALTDAALERLAQAEQLMSAARFEVVEAALAPLLAVDPPVPQAQVLAGWAAYQLDDYGRCVELMAAGLERAPRDWWLGWRARRVHAFALYKRGDYEAAAAAFRAALDAPVQPPPEERLMAPVDRERRRREQFDAERARMHYGLGLVELTLDRLEPARRHLERALELEPDYLKARHAWSELLAAEGKDTEALAANEALLADWPAHEDALNLRAQLLARAGREEEAEAAYERWREVYDARAEIGELRRLITEGRDTPETWLAIMKRWRQLGDGSEWRRALDHALRRHPDSEPLQSEQRRIDAVLRALQ